MSPPFLIPYAHNKCKILLLNFSGDEVSNLWELIHNSQIKTNPGEVKFGIIVVSAEDKWQTPEFN